MPLPDGVDPDLWGTLQDALAAALIDYGTARAVADAPTGETSKVTDLSFSTAGGSVTFSWSYRNQGDYDQNGEVNVADLTPIGLHYHKVQGGPDWTEAQLADGDENGEVNIGDVTPIGQNYQAVVDGYLLQSGPAASGPWDQAGQLDGQGDIPTGGGRRECELSIAEPAVSTWYRVAPFHGTGAGQSIGIASDPVHWVILNDPPEADLTADPTAGDPPLTVDFDASGSTDTDGSITDYEWDLDGNGTFNETGAEADARGNTTAQYTYDTAATYNPAVRVTDDEGATDTASVAITVNALPPTAALTADPTSGPTILLVNFDASGSTAPAGSITDYEWDMDGDGVYNEEEPSVLPQTELMYRGQATASWQYAQAGTYHPKVRVTDNLSATDTETVTIEVT
jgi:PKD repeat protein